ncbi:MAG TPA: hypothetical protein VIU61_15560 [Kofleriaceae bacterium]
MGDPARMVALVLMCACGRSDRAAPAPVSRDAATVVALDAAPDALVLRPRRPAQQIKLANAEALLENLAARMTAPTALRSRVSKASAIVRGTIASTDIKSHVPAKASLADPEVQKAVLQGELMMNVVEMTVESWLEGAGGTTAVAVYPSPNQASSADPAGPAVGESGLVLLERLPATPLGRELAKVKGAYGIAIVEPVVVPDPDGTLAAALAFRRTGDLLLFTKTLLAAKAGALQILIGIATREKRFTPALPVRARGKPDTAETLLVRAALWQLGDKKVALDGLVLTGLDDELGRLDTFANGDGTLTGASADTPIGLP